MNELRTFLQIEALLILALARRNRQPGLDLKAALIRLVDQTDFRAFGAQAKERLAQQVAAEIQAYGQRVIPLQREVLEARMTDMAKRAQQSTAREINLSRPTENPILSAPGWQAPKGETISPLPPVTPLAAAPTSAAPPPGTAPPKPAESARPADPKPADPKPAEPKKPDPAKPADKPPPPPAQGQKPAGASADPPPKASTRQTSSWNQYSAKWTQKDALAMNYLAKSQALYAGKFIDESLVKRARNIITRDYSLYGDNPAKIGELVKDGLVSMVDVTEPYWRTVAVNALNNARTYANLATMDEAGVQYFRFVAVLDERTTQICRHLDGKTWPVRPMLERMQKAQQATTLEELDRWTPMVRDVKNEAGEVIGFAIGPKDSPTQFSTEIDTAALAAAGACIPPLHFHCRSTIKPA